MRYPKTKSQSSSTISSSASTQSLSASKHDRATKKNSVLCGHCSRLIHWLMLAIAVVFLVNFRYIGITVPVVDAFSTGSSSSGSNGNSKQKPTSNKRNTHIGMPPLTVTDNLNRSKSKTKEFKSIPLSANPHTSNFARRINHPAAYEESPTFKGPLLLPQTFSTSEHRIRVRNYYQEYENADRDEAKDNNKHKTNRRIALPLEDPKPLKINASTDTILQKIMDNFAYRDAPVDIKELAESMEFYLRTRKRLMSAAHNKLNRNRKVKLKLNDKSKGRESEETKTQTQTKAQTKTKTQTKHTKNNKDVALVRVYDLCAGHGLTGMLFAACNPPKLNEQNNVEIRVETHLVDVAEPPSHLVLKELIGEVCPWIYDTYRYTPSGTSKITDSEEARSGAGTGAKKNNASAIHFHESSLEAFVPAVIDESVDDCVNIVISTHACGSLTDLVLETATSPSTPISISKSASASASAFASLQACAIASMPCCYTGTDKGMSYGIKRALGVAWAADLRRTMKLEDRGYRTDYTCIPVEITPLNRIILGEEKA